MNGSLIIGVDAGYGNYRRQKGFSYSNQCKRENCLYLRRIISRWMGNIYIIGEGHKGFVADKVTDDDNYVLTMAAVVKELEAREYMLKSRNVKVGYRQRSVRA